MKKSGKQKWIAGDEFVIPLEDESFGLGQIVAVEPQAMNSVICVFFNHRLEAIPESAVQFPKKESAISVLFVTRDLLDNGVWKVFSNSQPLDLRGYFPDIDERRAKGFVGTKIYGSGIVRRFLNAYFALSPWDVFAEPDYLDKLLLHPNMRPIQAIFTKVGG